MKLLNNNRMKSLLAMLLLGCFALAVCADAQPSIPRKSSKTTKSSSTSYSGNTVYGTAYDWLSYRYATYNDIANLDQGQIRVLKNSIYARKGYIFKDTRLSSYFHSLGWYSGWRKTVPQKEFNQYENANINFLKKYDH